MKAGIKNLFSLANVEVLYFNHFQGKKIKSYYLYQNENQFRIIRGSEEGIYGWIGANYLMNTFNKNSNTSYGILDMGGSSAQVNQKIIF